MLKHKIVFAKCVKQDIEASEFVLRATVELPNNDNIVSLVKKFVKSYTKNTKCHVNGNVLVIGIKAISKCSPIDVPDIIKGKRIAESKAKYQLYNLLKRISSEISNYYYKLSKDYSIDHGKYWEFRDREFNHISELDTK